MGVIDIIYNPRITGLCFNAHSKQIPWASGLDMLVWQAVHASELFQGKPIDADAARRVIDSIGKRMLNIALIGMPGCGKSTTGRELADMLSRPFVDLDDAFAERYGRTPAEVIESRGEWPFRQLECEVLREYGAKSGLVIACGGGVVTRQENYDLLHQNGFIVMLDRPIDQLSVRGRPLSQSKGVEALAKERMPIYESWADLHLMCSGSAEADAARTRELLGL
jgi:shikimate dehydrogenase